MDIIENVELLFLLYICIHTTIHVCILYICVNTSIINNSFRGSIPAEELAKAGILLVYISYYNT